MINTVKLKPRERMLLNGNLVEVVELKHSSVLFSYVDKHGYFELSRKFINKFL